MVNALACTFDAATWLSRKHFHLTLRSPSMTRRQRSTSKRKLLDQRTSERASETTIAAAARDHQHPNRAALCMRSITFITGTCMDRCSRKRE
jgi:hypothetical protein